MEKRVLLPSKNTNEKVIVYNTVHMYLQVFIDGREVYTLKGEEGRTVKTTGYCWNVIFLREEDAGREIVFQVTPVYRDSGGPSGDFYYGTYREIEHKVLAERLACAWEPYISEERIDENLQMLEREIQVFNDRGFVVPVSISVGYAVYQEGVDGGGLYSTMKRADTMMYERKQEYKRRKAGA